MKDINYLLIEANRLKVGGYKTINHSFYEQLIDAIYVGNYTAISRMQSFINKKIDWYKQDGALYGYPFEYYKEPLMRKQRYLATANTSEFVNQVYTRIHLLDTYRELAFVMFALRLVNPYDYLAHETDVGYVVGHFEVGQYAGGEYTDGFLHLNPSGYVRLMLGYIYNASEGIDYEVNPWDFVYHILQATKRSKLSTVSKLISSELDSGSKLGDRNVLGITDAVINKYTEEVTIMCPILARLGYLTKEDLIKVLVQVHKNKSKVEYAQFLLNNQDLFDVLNVSGVQFKCSWL